MVGFTGRNIAAKYSKLSRSAVGGKLSRIPSYVLHREVKRPRVYNPFILYRKRELLQADLIDLISRGSKNDNKKYILVVCDSYTRKCWARALEDKTTARVLTKFKEIYSESGYFERLMTDAGTEFVSGSFKAFLKKNQIGFNRGNPHAPHVERLNRTLQSKLFSYMSENETKRWIDVLDDVVSAYNNRHHRIIRMSPNEAENPMNKNVLLNNVTRYYEKAISKRKKPKFKVGDTVSVQKLRNVFAKGYAQTFTDELFRVHEIHVKLPIPMYTLTDYDGTDILAGRFYENEMQLADYDVFKIEKELGKRTRNGVAEVLVKWKGWPEKYNQWISQESLVREY